MRSRWLGGALVSGCLCVASTAGAAASFTADYLAGRWTTGTVEMCGKPEHERTVFREDGTFATEHAGGAVAVGFWRVEDDRLDMHVLATPQAAEPATQRRFDGGYGYVHIKALVFDVADDGFRMVQSAGDTLQGLNVVRCPEEPAAAARP